MKERNAEVLPLHGVGCALPMHPQPLTLNIINRFQLLHIPCLVSGFIRESQCYPFIQFWPQPPLCIVFSSTSAPASIVFTVFKHKPLAFLNAIYSFLILFLLLYRVLFLLSHFHFIACFLLLFAFSPHPIVFHFF